MTITVSPAVAVEFFKTFEDTDPNKMKARLHTVTYMLEIAQGGSAFTEYLRNFFNTEGFYQDDEKYRALLVEFFKQGTHWYDTVLDEGQPLGYRIRTLVSLNNEGEEVIEVGGGSVVEGVWKCTGVLEWFHATYPETILLAIQTRLETPAMMYSGLADAGDNFVDDGE